MRCMLAQLGGRTPTGQSPLSHIAAHKDTPYQRPNRDGPPLGDESITAQGLSWGCSGGIRAVS